ncbi:MAG: peptidoglycan-binding domain-containing protein [Nostocaceae cyanobacterium]|nr:peptidoglycan-binding domain-containing protein [Nostocaceae cyanobacterium]
MKGSIDASILNYLRSQMPFPISSASKFYWLLLCSCTPLLICSTAVISLAAPQKIAQVSSTGSINRPILRTGSQGETVSELQAALQLLGFYFGPINGIYNDTTARAVSEFKKAAGLIPDGVADRVTWQKLFPNTPQVASGGSSSGNIRPFPVPSQTLKPVTVGNFRTVEPTLKPVIPNRTVTSTVVQPTLKPAIPNRTVNSTIVEPTLKPATPKKPITSNTSRGNPTSSSSGRTNRSRTTTPTRQAARSRRTTRTSGSGSFSKKPSIQYTSQGLPILRLGMRGEEVATVQTKLRKLGFLKGSVDGDFGVETEAAVKAFQQRYGLEVDGVVGGATWQILRRR